MKIKYPILKWKQDTKRKSILIRRMKWSPSCCKVNNKKINKYCLRRKGYSGSTVCLKIKDNPVQGNSCCMCMSKSVLMFYPELLLIKTATFRYLIANYSKKIKQNKTKQNKLLKCIELCVIITFLFTKKYNDLRWHLHRTKIQKSMRCMAC